MTLAQHTLGHIACPACEQARVELMYSGRFGEYTFSKAVELWFAEQDHLKDTTRHSYSQRILPLKEFFGEIPLNEIHIGNIVTYQKQRQQQIRQSRTHSALKHGAAPDKSDGASTINHEVDCILRPVLKLAGKWAEIEQFYKPVTLPRHSRGIALTRDEEEYLVRLLKDSPRRLVAYCATVISLETTATPGELRHMRVCDYHLDEERPYLDIRVLLKNPNRERAVPLNQDALWAASALLERYQEACRKWNVQPCAEHFVLFHNATGAAKPQFDKPQTTWKRGFYSIRQKLSEKFPRLIGLRPYDMRHTSYTNLMGNPRISYSDVAHLSGHHPNMQERRTYDHKRNDGLWDAAESLNHHHTASPPKPHSPPLKRAGKLISFPLAKNLVG